MTLSKWRFANAARAQYSVRRYCLSSWASRRAILLLGKPLAVGREIFHNVELCDRPPRMHWRIFRLAVTNFSVGLGVVYG